MTGGDLPSDGWRIDPYPESWTSPSAFWIWAPPADADPWPRFHLFPRLERARIGASVAAGRVRDAWSVLRGAETIRDDWEDQT